MFKLVEQNREQRRLIGSLSIQLWIGIGNSYLKIGIKSVPDEVVGNEQLFTFCSRVDNVHKLRSGVGTEFRVATMEKSNRYILLWESECTTKCLIFPFK